MPNIGAVLKEEICRLAKREIKSATGSTKQAVAQYRRDIAKLKRLVQGQQKEIAFLKAQEQKRISQPQAKEEEDLEGVRYSPRSVRAQRERLGLSAEDYAKLIGVSGATVYNWEHRQGSSEEGAACGPGCGAEARQAGGVGEAGDAQDAPEAEVAAGGGHGKATRTWLDADQRKRIWHEHFNSLLACPCDRADGRCASPFAFREVGTTGLELSENGKPVFVYNHGMILAPGFPETMRRSSYLHPVYAPDGTILTDDFNADHPHHRGISWMWPEVTVDGEEGRHLDGERISAAIRPLGGPSGE